MLEFEKIFFVMLDFIELIIIKNDFENILRLDSFFTKYFKEFLK
jgi:hypothetical protein